MRKLFNTKVIIILVVAALITAGLTIASGVGMQTIPGTVMQVIMAPVKAVGTGLANTIAADTIVVCCGKVLGKPRDAEDARRMLSLLSGRDHQVMTGCTVMRGSRAVTFTEVTDLHFRPLLPQEIRRYILTGEPMDKAGAYGIQGGAALFCQRMEGDYYNVMGLPLCRLGQVLRDMAPEIWEDEAK